jgi:hypothetical protein
MDPLDQFDEAISQAWQEPRNDLGIRVVVPFEVNIEGQKAVVEAFIPDFGGPNGTVAVSKATLRHRAALSKMGYFTSILFPPYQSYSRERFIDTLNDWQWFGCVEERPVWYTGKPWS